MHTPKRIINNEVVTACHNKYEPSLRIAKSAARDFKDDPTKTKQFSYAHVLKLQGQDKGDDDNNGSTGTTPSN